MQSIFNPLRGKRYFTQLDLASGCFPRKVAKKNLHRTIFGEYDGVLYNFVRAGFGLTAIFAAFSRFLRHAFGPPNSDAASWLDGILILSYAWNEHLVTVTDVFSRRVSSVLIGELSKAQISCTELLRVFYGRILDDTSMKPSPPLKLGAMTNMPEPINVKQLRPFLGLAVYLHNFVLRYSIIAALQRNLLHNEASASERARKLLIEWEHPQQEAFRPLENAMSNPTALALPSCNNPFTLRTDASMVGAGELLTRLIQPKEFIIDFRRRVPTEV